jgi:hypothetical protein
MQRGKFLSIWERQGYAESLARSFYSKLGYKVPDSCNPDYMRDSKHPTEWACYEMALEAIETFMKSD